MAIGCLITGGFSLTCEDRKKTSGGLRTRIYVGNISELDTTIGDRGLTIDSNGYVTTINFTTYGSLYAFDGVKAGNDANDDITRAEGVGNVSYLHNVLFKAYDIDPTDRDTLEELAYSDGVFAIVERTAGVFEIFGRIEGLTLASAPRTLGTTPNQDTGRVITLSGIEPEAPKFVLDVDYATTKALLESYL